MPLKKGRSARIILELLHHPAGTLTKYRIAKETNTNISWVLAFLKRLEQKKIITGTRILDLNRIIDEYITITPKPKALDFFIQNPLEYLQRTKLPYALTTYAAENFTSYHLFLSRYDLYIRENDLHRWKEDLFKKGLIGQGNVRLLIPPDEYIFKFVKQRKKVKIVGIPLLLIDLKREGGACREAYEYLIGKYL